ncbi:hypothetical protein Aspvir_000580 [Aspergillus viridinutans]|uniref:Uncharacterized protein n=1 Tax=Aspergillus viridinutans TaxID=75553 RepID=A0A9P3BTJ6_ASPVI|nr:uncharacterized protein Aspvir_000580 [Aspergillus viridinutans]GIJ98463.1 hypothetical protein Aspvir_000580 [Aspergillus viridinutans]
MAKLLRKVASSWNLDDSAKRDKRDTYVKGLYELWEQVSTRKDPYLTLSPSDLPRIKCVDLLGESTFHEESSVPGFFRKMTHKKLRDYPINENNEETMGWHRRSKAFWSQTEKIYQGLRPIKQAAMMCGAMRLAFNAYKRTTSDGRQVTLRQVSGWKEADFADEIFHSLFDDEVLHSKHWYARDAWQSGKPQKQPHVMLTLAHEYEGNDSSLLCGEILAILATMLTRLESDFFKDHNIIPVMVLSFMADLKGRVLQAYFADDGLVIYKSRIFSFKEEAGEKSAELFLGYMGSEMIGATAVKRLHHSIPGDEATAVTEVSPAPAVQGASSTPAVQEVHLACPVVQDASSTPAVQDSSSLP